MAQTGRCEMSLAIGTDLRLGAAAGRHDFDEPGLPLAVRVLNEASYLPHQGRRSPEAVIEELNDSIGRMDRSALW